MAAGSRDPEDRKASVKEGEGPFRGGEALGDKSSRECSGRVWRLRRGEGGADVQKGQVVTDDLEGLVCRGRQLGGIACCPEVSQRFEQAGQRGQGADLFCG